MTGLSASADIPAGYYTLAVGKSDEALMTALEGIISMHRELSYNALWDSYPYTDAGSDGYYIDMYSTCKYNHDSPHRILRGTRPQPRTLVPQELVWR